MTEHRCLNERHYPQPEPPDNPLAVDERLHVADETLCVMRASYRCRHGHVTFRDSLKGYVLCNATHKCLDGHDGPCRQRAYLTAEGDTR